MIGRKYIKFIAVFLAVNFLVQTLGLTITYALTSGPAQPEFSSFEPVATTNMVNAFSGDFTYNLPLLEVPGPHGSSYPVSLSYHSGVSTEEEASWVGYGWTLNAGAINRSTRGFPDDYKDAPITYYNRSPKNWTATLGGGGALEIFSKDKGIGSVSATVALRYNNYKGFGKNAGIGLHLGRGVVNLGYNVSDEEGSFSLSVQPLKLLLPPSKKGGQVDTDKSEEQKQQDYKKNFANSSLGKTPGINLVGSNYGLFSMSEAERPTQVPAYSGASYNVSLNFEGNPFQLPVGVTVNAFGSYSHQKNDETTVTKALGYMYSSEHNDPDNQVMDYSVEKEGSFNKRDVFLGVPFNNADQFMVSAEGLSGGFRMYHKQIGSFGPRHMESKVHIINLSPEVDAGLNFGGGLDVGKGSQSMQVKDWGSNPSFSSPDADEDEPVFFRFNSDLGGSWGDSYNDEPVRASSSINGAGIPNFNLDMSQGERSGRSSYVGYNTVDETNATSSGKYYKAYSKREDIRGLRSSELEGHQVGEITVFNENGSRYVYGLPVLNRNEKHLSFGVRGASGTDIENNHIAYYANNEMLLGSEQPNAYASAYLLSEITTPDYIDRAYDGPTPDDFGGYTRFNYVKNYGDNGQSAGWFKWRNPYNGLHYSRSSLSDKKDDIGSVSAGEKEIVYLQSIETKSHVAVFYTADREDAMASVDYSNVSKGAKGTQKQKRLTRIELYSITDFRMPNGQIDRIKIKDPPSTIKPIKTVHFKYYGYDGNTEKELQMGAPNVDGTHGHLTLAKVYFEYNGINSGRISPYIFKYKYPGDGIYPSDPAEYATYDNYLGVVTDPAAENPNYGAFNSDAWGNYQPNGASQHDKMRPWINQSKKPNIDFDPAAWNLKVIQLPSKGEIHIQYEQDDYSYVQDQEAHVMAPLVARPVNGIDNVYQFYIDHMAIGLDPTHPEHAQRLGRLRDMIAKRYRNTNKRMYFKFLYQLKGNDTPDITKCDVEFIDGFAQVTGVAIVDGMVQVTLSTEVLPRSVCEDFVKANRLGMLNHNSCDASQGALNDGADPKSMVMQLLDFVGGSLVPNSLCKKINPEHSYLRVPTPIAKKGGGLRVKRLLTFDNSLGEKALYGSEYIYKTQNERGEVISSGVATNEPPSIREENILRDFVPRKGQTDFSVIIAGKDKEQAEGPIGESILPGASVGYSKVFTKSIYSGKTSPGYSVTEYLTAKEHPVKMKMTAIDDSKQKNRIITAVFMNEFLNHQYTTQGFSFILNQMHGQLKRTATFSGNFPGVAEAEAAPFITEQVNNYFMPGEDVPMLSSLYGKAVPKDPGREVDITMAQKMIMEESFDLNVEADFTVGVFFAFVVPFLTAMPTSTVSESILATHATTKVVRYPAILKSTTSYQDGIYHTSENLAFNEVTGQPVMVRSYDEFSGVYLKQDIPAAWQYENFGSKAEKEGLTFKSSADITMEAARNGSMEAALTFGGYHGCEMMSMLTPGDLLEFDNTILYHVQKLDFVQDKVILTKSAKSSDVIPVGSIASFKILNSGRSNILAQQAGSMTLHDQNKSNLTAKTLERSYEETWNEGNTPDVPEDAEDGTLFIKNLNSEVKSVLINNNTEGATGFITLAGPYKDMTLVNYAAFIPETCSTDLKAAHCKEFKFRYDITDGTVKLELQSFRLDCDPSDAEDWNLILND